MGEIYGKFNTKSKMFTNGVLQSKAEGETAISHKALQKAALHFPSELLKIIINMQGRDASGYSELRNTLIQAWIYQRLCSYPHPIEESSRAHVSSHPTHLQPFNHFLSIHTSLVAFRFSRLLLTQEFVAVAPGRRCRQVRTVLGWRLHSGRATSRLPS